MTGKRVEQKHKSRILEIFTHRMKGGKITGKISSKANK